MLQNPPLEQPSCEAELKNRTSMDVEEEDYMVSIQRTPNINLLRSH